MSTERIIEVVEEQLPASDCEGMHMQSDLTLAQANSNVIESESQKAFSLGCEDDDGLGYEVDSGRFI